MATPQETIQRISTGIPRYLRDALRSAGVDLSQTIEGYITWRDRTGKGRAGYRLRPDEFQITITGARATVRFENRERYIRDYVEPGTRWTQPHPALDPGLREFEHTGLRALLERVLEFIVREANRR